MGVLLAFPAATPNAAEAASDFRDTALRIEFRSVITNLGNFFSKFNPRLVSRKPSAASVASNGVFRETPSCR